MASASYDFNGRVAAITGAARGIGLTTARRMAQAGARIALIDRDANALNLAAAQFPDPSRILPIIADITDPDQAGRAIAQARTDLGGLHILVNNAGIAGPSKPATEYSNEDWRSVMAINIDAAFWCARAAIPLLKEQGWGRIVNIASIAGKEGNPNAGAYSASKAALIGLTKSLAKELAQTGVLVNCIAPAGVKTEIFNQISEQHIHFMLERIPMGRFGETEEVAALITWLASDECSFSTGAVYDLSGGRATY